MHGAPVVILRKIQASPRAVWLALTRPHEIARWHAAGASYEVVRALPDESRPGHYHADLQSAGSGSLVSVEITPAGDGTELVLRLDAGSERTDDEREWKTRVRRLARHLESR